MNTNDLLRGFGEIDEELLWKVILKKEILSKERHKRRKRRQAIMRITGIAATITAIIILGYFAITGSFHRESGVPLQTIENRDDPAETMIEEDPSENESEESPEDMTQNRDTVTGMGWAEQDRWPKISDTQCVVITVGGGLDIRDADGNLLKRLDGAAAVIPNAAFDWEDPLIRWDNSYGQGTGYSQFILEGKGNLAGAVVWEREKPLPVIFPDEPSNPYSWLEGPSGMYSISTDRWLADPQEHVRLNMLSENVWTDTAMFVSSGSLMKTDGSIIDTSGKQRRHEDTTELQERRIEYTRYVNVIIGNGKIFSLNGDYIADIPAAESSVRLADILDDGCVFVGTEPGNPAQNVTYIYDLDGGVRVVERSGLSYTGHAGGLLNWQDANGRSLITDRDLNPVLTEEMFFEINPGFSAERVLSENPDYFRDIGSSASDNWLKIRASGQAVFSETEEPGDLQLQFMGAVNGNTFLFTAVCDRDFHLLATEAPRLPDLADRETVQFYLAKPEEAGAQNNMISWADTMALTEENLFYLKDGDLFRRELKPDGQDLRMTDFMHKSTVSSVVSAGSFICYTLNSTGVDVIRCCRPDGSDDDSLPYIVLTPASSEEDGKKRVSKLLLAADGFFLYTTWQQKGTEWKEVLLFHDTTVGSSLPLAQSGTPEPYMNCMEGIPELAGAVKTDRGPCLVFLRPEDEDRQIMTVINIYQGSSRRVFETVITGPCAVVGNELYYRQPAESNGKRTEYTTEESVSEPFILRRFSFADETDILVSDNPQPAGTQLSECGLLMTPLSEGFAVRRAACPDEEPFEISAADSICLIGGLYYISANGRLQELDIEMREIRNTYVFCDDLSSEHILTDYLYDDVNHKLYYRLDPDSEVLEINMSSSELK